MDQRMHMHQKMSQRLIMTPQMQQSIQVLQLSTLELQELLQQEMVENPMLEYEEYLEDEDYSDSEYEASSIDESTNGQVEGNSDENREDTSEASEPPVADTIDTGRIELDEHWEEYFADSSDLGYVGNGTATLGGEEDEEMQTQMAHEKTLKDHLLWQLGVTTQTERQYQIGEYIIEQLDEDGYLRIPLKDIAATFDRSVEQVEEVLALIHGFDPPGIGARNLAECLEIQCRQYEIDDDDIIEVICHHLENLERRRYKEVARALEVSEQHVQEIADIIANLDPRPGRQYRQESVEYITPDVFIEKVDGEWQVRVNDDGAPPLRINRKYREMLEHTDQITEEEYDFIKKKFQSAIWLIRNIEQRKRTLYRVTKSIMDKQIGFLDEGLTGLKPLKLRDIAEELGIHEATVCRVVNKKYVQTPRGLFELKYFFSTGLDTSAGDNDMSAKSVMEIVRNLIEQEDDHKPLSDQKITEILHRDHNLKIARRTVAKYREKMGILPTSKRKRV